ncbi:VOC family protein [Arthrobacter sp. NPDC097144]|uniref:VOC family protein n=1 Tax=Arthrobacter sp. NPDC097144 TaxID=3363946 RepID=UPI003822F47A
MYPVIYPHLRVADLDRSTGFYMGLGFSLNERLSTVDLSAMNISAAIVLVLLPKPFNRETRTAAAFPTRTALAFPTRSDVDEILAACTANGGKLISRARVKAKGVYLGTAADPDGHLWDFLCRDGEPWQGNL